MTIGKAIELVDKINPNEFDREDKIVWLSNLDEEIHKTLLKNYTEFESTFGGYSVKTKDNTALLIDDSYSDIYIQWLLAKIYLFREEIQRYNNSINIYNELMYQFRNYINRTCTHRSDGKINNYKAWGD